MENYTVLVLVLLLTAFISAQDDDDNSMVRLPDTIAPESYDLSLKINPDEEDFSGTVNISFHFMDENYTIEYIYLHADTEYITITFAQINGAENCTTEGRNNQIMKFSCGNITKKSNFLYITFNGKFSQSDGYGLVKSANLVQSREQSLVESYFEPTFARRAFPCFDEPHLRANFSVTVTYPSDYSVVSNTPAIQSYTFPFDVNYTSISFEPTMKISTYLVSIFVSKFNEEDYSVEDEQLVLKFLTRPGAENVATKATSTHYAPLILQVLGNFTGQSFREIGSFELYQVAVPNYYAEHEGGYGMFTYKERDLLDEGNKTSTKATKHIIQTLAYTLSHQWFGGEVSPFWWSDVWAYEAIPMYFKYTLANQIEKDFEFLNQFVTEVVQKSMQYDALPFDEPLSSNESDVTNEWKIETRLNHNSLLKGAALLHMINYMVEGDDQFKENIQNFVQNQSNSDTGSKGILEFLTQHDGIQNLYSASEPWVFEEGFPILNIKISSSTGEMEVLNFSQKQFVYSIDNNRTNLDNNVKWTIPISYTTSNNKNFNATVNVYYTPNIELFINIRKGNWVIFNLQGRYHYRVNYDKELWRRIINALNNKTERAEIHPLNRAQLIDDIFNIARIGDVDYSLAFELADTLIYETEYYPWYSAFNAFSYLLGKMSDDDTEENLKSYILKLMEHAIKIPSLDSSQKEDERHIDVMKEVMMLDWACKLGHYECVAFAMKQFAKYMKNQASLEDYNLRPVILCNGIRYSQNISVDWRALWSIYVSSASVHEKNDILHALGCSEDQRTLEDYLLYLPVPALTAEIKRQDAMVTFESTLSNSAGIEAAQSFLGSSLNYIKYIYNGADDEVYVISDMILALAEKLYTDDQIQWLQGILNSEAVNNYADLKKRASIMARVNNYWSKQYQETIKALIPVPTTTTESTSTTTTESTSESTVTVATTTELSTTPEPSTTTESSGRVILGSLAFTLTCLLYLSLF